MEENEYIANVEEISHPDDKQQESSWGYLNGLILKENSTEESSDLIIPLREEIHS